MIIRSNDHTIKEVIAEMIKEFRLSDKLRELNIMNAWPAIVGKVVNKHTTSIKLNEGTLYVSLDNAAMRHELHMARSKLVKALNKKLHEDVLKEIIFR